MGTKRTITFKTGIEVVKATPSGPNVDKYSELFDSVKEFRTDSEIPKVLYHYTSSEGLLGILSQKCLWLSHVKSFEDASEQRYGIDLIYNIIKERINKTNKERHLKFLEILLERFTYDEEYNEWFAPKLVVSFCESDNLLSQWDKFADSGGGYCLGFSFSEELILGYDTSKGKAVKAKLRKVIYDGSEQKKLIQDVLEFSIEFLDKYDSVNPTECASVVGGIIYSWVNLFKNEAFRYEKEWRIVIDLDALGKPRENYLKFRTRNSHIVPYISVLVLDPNSTHESKFPISEISYGPRINHVNDHALQYFLKKNNLPKVEIKKTNLSLR